MPESERNWGILWELGTDAGWVTDGKERARYTKEEARARVVEFRKVAIWRQLGYVYAVRPLT